MRQTTGTRKSPGEKIVKDIKRATRKHYSSEEKIRIGVIPPESKGLRK
jgi:transposase